MQIASILTVCLGVMLASAPTDAGPRYITAPPAISSLCPMPPGPYPLIMSNPVDCGSFYMCSWSTAFLQKCPEGLHFNPKVQVCDHPMNAPCNIAKSSGPDTVSTTEIFATTEDETETTEMLH